MSLNNTSTRTVIIDFKKETFSNMQRVSVLVYLKYVLGVSWARK